MNKRYALSLILIVDAFFLLLQIDELSISYLETQILYGDFSFLQLIIQTSISLFGQNDFALRLPMISLHLMSVVLLYKISQNYLKLYRNRIWLVLLFILLPGVISSAIVVNEAGLVLFCLFLFVYIYENYSSKVIYPLLVSYLFISGSFTYLFFSLAIFSLNKKDKNFFIFNTILLVLSVYLFGSDAKGIPRGHFLDSLGIYATIFTPIIFLYLFYALYRRYLTKELDLLWFISSATLIISLLLSFRQRVNIEHFAPFVILALPIIAQTFEHSYRVRLNMFRKRYKIMFIVSIVLLLINSSVVVFNKYLYCVIQNPKKHFSYKMHVAKELAKKLQTRGIYCVSTDFQMQKRLNFYGVTKCNKYRLQKKNLNNFKAESVTISYKNIPVYTADVTKLNIN